MKTKSWPLTLGMCIIPLHFSFLPAPAHLVCLGFPGGSDSKESACNAGDTGSIPASGRSPEEGNGYPLQGSCLENSMDRGVWQATVHGVAESDATEQHTHVNYPLFVCFFKHKSRSAK